MTIDREKFRMRERTMPEHMSNLDKLTPATLRGAKFAVVEIADAVQVDARRGEDRRGEPKFEAQVVLRYKEIPNRVHWLNKVAVNTLCEVFGDDEAAWVGKKVPIVVRENVKNPSTREANDMVWVAPEDEWDDWFAKDKEARAARTRPTSAAKKDG